jgi:hypothetical protein
MELSDISAEAVQIFLNQKMLDGKAVQTLKNLKWHSAGRGRTRPAAHHLATPAALGDDQDDRGEGGYQGSATTPWPLSAQHSSYLLCAGPRRVGGQGGGVAQPQLGRSIP